MIEGEVGEIAGPRGKHLGNHRAYWHGTEKGSVILAGRKLAVRRPSVRTKDGREMRLASYETFQDESLFTEACFVRLLHGRSCRRYHFGHEPVGSEVLACSTAKSGTGWRFAALASKALEELLTRPLKGERYFSPSVGRRRH